MGLPSESPRPARGWIVPGLVALWGAATFALVFRSLQANCQGTWDYGVFFRAARGIAAFDLNPTIPFYGTTFFNDHFDPAIAPAAFFSRALGHPFWALALFETLWIAATALVFDRLLRARRIPPLARAASVALVLFHRSIFDGVLFPVHPSVWAILPAILVVDALDRGRPRRLFGAGVALLLFKEVFPFSTLALAGGILAGLGPRSRDPKRLRGAAAALAAVSVLWMVGVFVLKPRLLGAGRAQGAALAHAFLAHPFAELARALAELNWTGFLRETWMLLALGALLFRARQASAASPANAEDRARTLRGLLLVLLFVAPYLAIHALANKLSAFQYPAFYCTTLLAWLAFQNPWPIPTVGSPLDRPARVLRGLALAIVIAAVLVGASRYVREARRQARDDYAECTYSPEKRRETEAALAWIDARFAAGENLVATTRFSPRLLAVHPRFEVAGQGRWFDVPFAGVALERGRLDRPGEIDEPRIQAWIARCRAESAAVDRFESSYYFIARCPLSPETGPGL